MRTNWRRLGLLVWLGFVLGLRLLAEPVPLTNAVTGRGLVLGTGTYESGTSVTLRAAPQVDWKFDHWEGVPAKLSPGSAELLTTHRFTWSVGPPTKTSG